MYADTITKKCFQKDYFMTCLQITISVLLFIMKYLAFQYNDLVCL
jgi:hypothetical protein